VCGRSDPTDNRRFGTPSSVRWVGKVVIALIFAEARLRAALSKAA
jgi:hypothetical protein